MNENDLTITSYCVGAASTLNTAVWSVIWGKSKQFQKLGTAGHSILNSSLDINLGGPNSS
jgi:hypothetical protein